ncbi:MAG: bifunctional 4-hydroxy-3-methylbut-2-enyl diphosphate reductase/30S ribosomal protein S1 [Christensenellales bacterium]
MKIIVAKSAGFCFGVRRAVQAVEDSLKKEDKVYTYGPLIHNDDVVLRFAQRGALPVESLDGLSDCTLIIRSHGVAPEVYEQCARQNINIVDATCPFVKRIHTIVEQHAKSGYAIIIVGHDNHPEVMGIKGWSSTEAEVLGSLEDAKQYLNKEDCPKKVCVVAQTTIPEKLFFEITDCLQSQIPEVIIKNTICETTIQRQNEAEELAKKCDRMIVIGGHHSSNTQKLAQICKNFCKNTVTIANRDDVILEKNMRDDIITGVITGASTPDWMIREVLTIMIEQENATENIIVTDQTEMNEEPKPQDTEATMSNEKEDVAAEEESFAEAFEKTLTNIRVGQLIKGTVVQIVNEEVCVNIGYKSDGFIPQNEFSSDPNVVPSDVIKVGDEIEVSVVKVNDGEGNVILSKKSVDTRNAMNKLFDSATDTIFDTVAAEVVKGGVVCYIDGVRAFVPAAQLSTRYIKDLKEFQDKPLRVKIIESDKAKKRIIASQKVVLEQEAASKKKELLATIQADTLVSGIVQRLTNFGAFVDLGGIDGLLHVTDMSWGRIKHPSDVVKVGQELTLKVLSIDVDKERISLGLIQTMPHPWETAEQRYVVGSVIEGKVVRIGSFGAFIYLEPGIDGLVHISQVATRRVEKVEDELKVGDVINVKVLAVDSERRRISLSRKAVLVDEMRAKQQEEAAVKAQEKTDEKAPESSEAAPEAEKKPKKEKEEKVVIPPVEEGKVSLAEFFPTDAADEFKE